MIPVFYSCVNVAGGCASFDLLINFNFHEACFAAMIHFHNCELLWEQIDCDITKPRL